MISAPGEDILAALPLRSDVYVRTDGTSVAAAVAAGAFALLMQAFPDAPVSLVERALIESAADLGTPGPDNDSGYGRISVDKAMTRLSELTAGLP
jgi:subtilisin family serine protease